MCACKSDRGSKHSPLARFSDVAEHLNRWLLVSTPGPHYSHMFDDLGGPTCVGERSPFRCHGRLDQLVHVAALGIIRLGGSQIACEWCGVCVVLAAREGGNRGVGLGGNLLGGTD